MTQAPQAAMGLAKTREQPLAPEDDTQQQLLRAAAEGDERAMVALYRTHVDRVHRHIARILGADDPDAEDVVQQVFLAALDGAHRFDGRARVSTWLLGIATRRALDAARARARRQRWQRALQRLGVGPAAPRPDVRHGAMSDVEAALAELRPHQRTVFVLHDVEGYTLAEIREMTGTGISTLHARLKAARKRIDAAGLRGEEHGRSRAGGDDEHAG